ncbi:MAG: ABC transporter permease [Bacteroidota bacterium]
MYLNSLLLSFRNALKTPLFTLINLLGLSIGLAACLLIVLFIENERSFDRFHTQKDHIYRLNEVQTWEGIIPQNVALSMYPMGPTLFQDYPEITSYVRLIDRSNLPFQVDGKRLFVEKMYLTDTTFFSMFDFPMLYGNPQEALNAPNSVVVTEATASQFFGRTDVLGEQLTLYAGDTIPFKVTGVLKDVPDNSHIQFDGLMSIPTFPEADSSWMNRWGNNWLVTYLELQAGVDIEALESKFPDYLVKYMGEDAPEGYQLFLQELTDVHLGSSNITHDYQNYRKFNGKYVKVFAYLALFVLIIAGINFMNLSTARSAKRALEVGVRKSIGASKGMLARGFLAETFLFTTLAFLIALGIVALVLPFLNEFAQRAMSLSTLFTPRIFLPILGIWVLIGSLSGFYPAWVMANFDVVKALKGNLFIRHQKISLQNILVVVQFTLAIALIIGTLLIARQLNFMLNQDPGFNREQVLLLPGNREVNQQYESFKQELLQYPEVLGVSASGQRLGSNIHQTGINYREDTAVQSLAISSLNVDYNYLDFYEIDMEEGRGFSKAYTSDSAHGYVINQVLAEKIGYDDPIGKPFKFSWEETWGKVIGVTKNFNYNSYHHDINPLALHVRPDWGYSEVSVRINPNSLGSLLPKIEKHWRETGTDRDLTYEFLDEHFAEVYMADSQVNQLVRIIAFLAVFVACLGLFGLIHISAERRTKEIGVRKILGASVGNLVSLFTREVAILVGIAFLIAVLPTWWFMSNWLEGFAFRIEMGPWIFILSGFFAMLIALGTIGFKALHSARSNPVDCLRYE